MWTDYLQTQIFTRIKNDPEMMKLQEKYPDFILTTSAVSSTSPTFPTLLFQQLESVETGQDLDNTTINVINAGFQIDVVDNQKTRTRVNAIMSEAKRIMKSMRFNITYAPDQDTQDEKRSTFRAARIIGSGETL